MATTEALLEATLQVLVRHGYARLTTTRVAERAGVSVGTLYQYFPDKRSLVTALKVRYFGLLVDSVGRALAEAQGGGIDSLMRRALGGLLAAKREHLELTKALREPLADTAGHSFLRETHQHFVAVILPHVRRALPPEQRTDPQLERRVALLVSAIEGALSHAVYEAPALLGEAWFLDELVTLGTGYFRESMAQRGAA